MAGLWRYDPAVKGPKYIVLRRDGTVPEWDWFVVGAKDPVAPWAMRAYAGFALLILRDWRYARDVWRLAEEFSRYRKTRPPEEKKGDPNATRHREDDPATLALLKPVVALTPSPEFRIGLVTRDEFVRFLAFRRQKYPPEVANNLMYLWDMLATDRLHTESPACIELLRAVDACYNDIPF